MGKRSEAKGFYRLLSNEKLDMANLSTAVQEATNNKLEGTVLLIEDTSDINLNGHKKTDGLGYSSEYIRGIKLHSCIATTEEGLPLGLIKQYYETRETAKSKLSKQEKKNRPIEEKESYRWLKMLEESTAELPDGVKAITICDREGDFYELYAQALGLGEDFIIRVSHDRNTESESNEKLMSQIRRTKALGEVEVVIPRNSRASKKARTATMEVAACRIRIKKPVSVTDDSLPDALEMNIVRITEIGELEDPNDAIEWILATSLPVNTEEEVMRIVGFYVNRWKIERFHFVLKSGCNVEKIQQRSYDKIKVMLLIYSVIAMYIMTITYLGRLIPNMPCDVFLEKDEWQTLYRIINRTKKAPEEPYSMEEAVKYLGELGSYRRAPSDGPPGLKSIWKGLLRLFDYLELLIE